MPIWGPRGSYAAVTFTVVMLVVVGLVARCGSELVPPQEQNDLAAYQAEFLLRASRQRINWRTTGMNPFAEARRLDRPLMLVAGGSWSQAARRFDAVVFASPEVAARLNRDFVCVRVDLAAEPEWRGALLPVQRSQLDVDPGYTVWFFTPSGELLTWSGRRFWEERPDHNGFLGVLGQVLDLREAGSDGTGLQSEVDRRSEVRMLRRIRTRSVPDVQKFVASLDTQREFVTWEAAEYRLLLGAGLTDAMAERLDAALLSPAVDLVDGGFFRLARGLGGQEVEFDKSAATTAEMAALLARAWRATGAPLYRYMCYRAVQSLRDQHLDGQSWASFVEAAVSDNGRSGRNSFGAASLRTRFTAKERAWAPTLGLKPGANKLMVPYLPDAETLTQDRARLDAFVDRLREIGDPKALSPGGFDLLDSAGIVVARAIETALIVDDGPLLQEALGWSARLRSFRAGADEVRHSLRGTGAAHRWLGDYTAYADAMLQTFVATGDERPLQEGAAVLARALFLYSRDDPGDIVAVTDPPYDMGAFSLEMPSIVDDGGTPALPELMRIAFRYGAVLGDAALIKVASDVTERFAAVANETPSSFASYFAAANEVVNAGCLIVAGPDSVERAKLLALRHPDKFVAPAAAANAETPEAGVYSFVGLTSMIAAD